MLALFAPLLQSATTEDLIWDAVFGQVKELKSEKQFHEAQKALENYLKQYPKNTHLGEISLEQADLFLNSLNDIETGFHFLEKARTLGMQSNENFLALKERFATPITEKRLHMISFFLYKFFLDRLEYPETLTTLSGKFTHLPEEDFIDGFGKPFIYASRPSKVIKGDNRMSFDLFSAGPDGIPGNEDDLTLKTENASEPSHSFKLLGLYEEEGIWTADLEYPDKDKRNTLTRKIREGMSFDDYFVFGIAQNGVVLVKDNEALVIKRN